MTLDTQAKHPVEAPSTSKKRRNAMEAAVGGDLSPVRPPSTKGGDAPTSVPADASSLELPLHAAAQSLDREVRAALGRATGSLSVGSALLADGDWGVNLLVSPKL